MEQSINSFTNTVRAVDSTHIVATSSANRNNETNVAFEIKLCQQAVILEQGSARLSLAKCYLRI